MILGMDGKRGNNCCKGEGAVVMIGAALVKDDTEFIRSRPGPSMESEDKRKGGKKTQTTNGKPSNDPC